MNALRELEIRFSFGFDLIEPVRDAILLTPPSACVPAITQAGDERDGATVCELSDLDLSAWPEGTSVGEAFRMDGTTRWPGWYCA